MSEETAGTEATTTEEETPVVTLTFDEAKEKFEEAIKPFGLETGVSGKSKRIFIKDTWLANVSQLKGGNWLLTLQRANSENFPGTEPRRSVSRKGEFNAVIDLSDPKAEAVLKEWLSVNQEEITRVLEEKAAKKAEQEAKRAANLKKAQAAREAKKAKIEAADEDIAANEAELVE